MKEPKWIRLVKLKGNIPTHAHPDNDTAPIRLTGKFSVKWPNGDISLADLKTSTVHVLHRDDTKESGLYTYFEGPLNGMTIIYNLHEVELHDDEVVRCLAAPKKTRAA